MCHVDVTGVHLISIPAPPRGATLCLPALPSITAYFNSRPSARGDSLRFSFPHATRVFQFTPLREGRPRCNRQHRRGAYFNSRPSARGDEIAEKQDMSAGISIHAPPRGATPLVMPRSVTMPISIHAPPRGATAAGRHDGGAGSISIPAPPRGATCTTRRP